METKTNHQHGDFYCLQRRYFTYGEAYKPSDAVYSRPRFVATFWRVAGPENSRLYMFPRRPCERDGAVCIKHRREKRQIWIGVSEACKDDAMRIYKPRRDSPRCGRNEVVSPDAPRSYTVGS